MFEGGRLVLNFINQGLARYAEWGDVGWGRCMKEVEFCGVFDISKTARG